MIDASNDAADILEQCLQSNHTRLPVFRDDPENIVGVIHAKDLLRAMYKLIGGPDGDAAALKKFDISRWLWNPISFLRPQRLMSRCASSCTVARILHWLWMNTVRFKGLITLEDILEEIVGEITDEFDPLADHAIKTDRCTGSTSWTVP